MCTEGYHLVYKQRGPVRRFIRVCLYVVKEILEETRRWERGTTQSGGSETDFLLYILSRWGRGAVEILSFQKKNTKNKNLS